MIKVKLDILAKSLGKSVTDIADETGLNRNTVTALFHNKVDGIKFDTLEKICAIYGVPLEDILEIGKTHTGIETKSPEKLYKQEGSIVPFTGFPWVPIVNDLPKEFFRHGMGFMRIYYKDEYGQVYWDHNALYDLARQVYNEYGKVGRIHEIYGSYKLGADAMEHLYETADFAKLSQLNQDELLTYFHEVWGAGQKFWKYSIFIDSFDPGLDQDEIRAIAAQHNLTTEEIAALTTPAQPTFNNERRLHLLRLIKPLFKKNWGKERVMKFAETNKEIEKYIKKFDYYKSNYSFVKPITKEEVAEEIYQSLQSEAEYKDELNKLELYEKNHAAAVKRILAAHKLKKNPLEFFSLLTYWREERKKVNLMSICLYEMIFRVVEERTGVPKRYLKYLSHDEFPNAIKGIVDKDFLIKRRDEGVVVEVRGTSYTIITGNQATSVREELEQKMRGESLNQSSIAGQTACQGYAKGIAKVILDESEFHKLKEGEILVTGMTRPEFVPLMKIAGGIVTNEGGITCHAAIVSRELGKPCIIGTQVATQIIKDGDLVEVRANHGTVRILK